MTIGYANLPLPLLQK